MKRKIFAFSLLAMFAAVTLLAATAKIRKVWLEHNVTINNKKAMKVHCEFDVQGMNGKTGSMLIWIKGPSGKWHNVNSQYKSNTGTPYFKWDYKPNYDNAYYEDYWYAPYVADLNILSGKNDYKVVVTITDEHQQHIAQSDEITFTGTGSSGSNNNSNQNQQRSAQKPSVQQNQYTQSWREDLPGGFVIVTKHPGGATQRVRYRACPTCHGSTVCGNCYGAGFCPLCNGQCGIISAGYGTYIPCALCSSTGFCAICKGSKKCYCTQNGNPYPGYVIGGETWLDARGNVISKEKVNYNGGVNDTYYGNEGNSSSRRSSSKKTCPDCGGTRLFQGGHSPEYAQPRSQLVGYYNSQGSKCPHCGYYSKHWHSKCTTCMHISGTKNPYR